MQIIVLGMHRSGTSTLARLLNMMGCYFGDENVTPPAGRDNPKGFWERTDVIVANDAILKDFSATWWSVDRLGERPDEPDADDRRDLLTDILLKLDSHRPWFIKDPRLCLTLDRWLPVLECPVFLHMQRSPLDAAGSLNRRNGIPLEYAFKLGEFYTRRLLNILGDRPRISVHYEDLIQAPYETIHSLHQALSEAGVRHLHLPRKNEVLAFVDPNLNHFHAAKTAQPASPAQQELSAALQAGLPFHSSREQMDTLRMELRALKEGQAWVEALRSQRQPNTMGPGTDPGDDKKRLLALQQQLTVLKLNSEEQILKLEAHLRGLYNSRLVQGAALLARILGRTDRGLVPEMENIRRLFQEPVPRSHALLGFLAHIVWQPMATLRLLTWRRVINFFRFLFHDHTSLDTALRRYDHFFEEHSIAAENSISIRDKENSAKPDIFIFPVIDWDFRHQRPQHLALELGKLGYRVFYFATAPFLTRKEGSYRVTSVVAQNVYCCSLGLRASRADNIYRNQMSSNTCREYLAALTMFMKQAGVTNSVSILHHFYWRPLADVIPGTTICYDCLDLHAGFNAETAEMQAGEVQLIKTADIVVSTSSYLHAAIGKIRENHLIRNGCEYALFAADGEHFAGDGRPTAGYVGAIAGWFDTELLYRVAKLLPDWRFVLAGGVTGCDTSALRNLNNVIFVGEVPYAQVPYYIRGFDVCMIPFRIIELTKATNPVKAYEYLAAGKPVVATRLPELAALGDRTLIGDTAEAFASLLRQAASKERGPEAIAARQTWAAQQDWAQRAGELETLILSANKRVSIVVLTYNNLTLTKECLESIEKNTYYDNYELILVDNASTDGTPEYLRSICQDKRNWTVIENSSNLGFSAGNNIGIHVASGEYVVLLNNDTIVTPGWLKNLIRPFASDSQLGLTGAVTNNIGNEAKIDINYRDPEEMLRVARDYTSRNARKLLYVDRVAFFCVAMRKTVIDSVGLLDEQFGIGLFEDDDYCMRTKKQGFSLAIVEDCFVHHHLSASINKMDIEKKTQLFERNKSLFEAKWGPWIPHTYRKK